MESSLESWNKQFVEKNKTDIDITNLNNAASWIIIWSPLEQKHQSVHWLQLSEILFVQRPELLHLETSHPKLVYEFCEDSGVRLDETPVSSVRHRNISVRIYTLIVQLLMQNLLFNSNYKWWYWCGIKTLRFLSFLLLFLGGLKLSLNLLVLLNQLFNLKRILVGWYYNQSQANFIPGRLGGS